MNAENTVISDMSSSFEKTGGILSPLKSKPEIYEQTKLLEMSSASTSRTILIMMRKSNTINTSTSIIKIGVFVNFVRNLLIKFPNPLIQQLFQRPSTSCKELADGMKCITENFDLCISVQNERIPFFLEIKETLETIFNIPLNRVTLSQAELVLDLTKSLIVPNRLADETGLLLLRLEGLMDEMSRQINKRFSTHQMLLDALKKTNKSFELYIAGNIALKNIFAEIRALLDAILSKKSRFDYRVKNIGYTGFIDIQNTGTS